jgi:hypothetical protein
MAADDSIAGSFRFRHNARGGRGDHHAGTRITVDDVLSNLAAGMRCAEILVDFPDLEDEDYLAGLPSPRTANDGWS